MPKAVAAAIAEATVPETTIQFRQAITEALAEEEEMERDPTVFVAGEDVGLTSGLYERLALLDPDPPRAAKSAPAWPGSWPIPAR